MTQLIDGDEGQHSIETPAAPKRKGWPKGKRRAAPAQRETSQRAPQRERLQRAGRQEISFSIDPSRIPKGMSYQWCAKAILGQEDDRVRQTLNHMYRNHWKPVPANRHPEVFGMDATEQAGVIRGLVLCERPSYLTDEARDEDKLIAREQVMDKVKSLGMADKGQMERIKPTVRAKYDLSVPEDAASSQ